MVMTNKRLTFSTFCDLLSQVILCLGLLYVLINILCWPYARYILPYTLLNLNHILKYVTIAELFQESALRVTAVQVFYVLFAFLTVRLIGLAWPVFRRHRRTLA
jgi:hypothetical protein